jgi:hypothetical protein
MKNRNQLNKLEEIGFAMKKPLLLLIATMMLVLSSCSITILPNRTLLGYRKCAANDPIRWHIKQGTGKQRLNTKIRR